MARLKAQSITYTSRVGPWLEHAFYALRMRGAGGRGPDPSSGSLHLYLLYVAAGFVASLVLRVVIQMSRYVALFVFASEAVRE